MIDGLYRIVRRTRRGWIVAGFVCDCGRVVRRAPILRKWTTVQLIEHGVWVCR